MQDSALVKKLDAILRSCKDQLDKVDHIWRFLKRVHPHVDEPTDGHDDANGDGKDRFITPPRNPPNKSPQNHSPRKNGFWEGFRITEAIQCVVGTLLLCTLVYSVRSYNLSVDTRSKQLRAYVTMESITIQPSVPIVADVGYRFEILFKNTGQTPALHNVLTIHQETSGKSECENVKTQSPYTSAIDIGPGQIGSNYNEAFRLGQTCVDELNRGTTIMKIHGEISYKDIFGESHHTLFCNQYEALTTHHMSACPEGWSMD